MTAILPNHRRSGLIKRTPEADEIPDDKRFTGIIPFESDYPGEVESFATHLPATARRLYGCNYCEWRKFGICPHGFRQGRGFDPKVNRHPAGICVSRVNYLLSFTRGYKVRPSYAQWRKDFNSAMADLQLKESWVKLKLVEQQLLDLPDSADLKEGKVLEARRKGLRSEWHMLWKDLAALDDREVDRQAPKKVEVEHTHLRISDIHNIIRGTAVDAEFTAEEKEDEDGS